MINQFVKVAEIDGDKVVDANELFRVFWHGDMTFEQWVDVYIKGSPVAELYEDYLITQDNLVALTEDFATHIAMMANSRSGNIVRNYYMEIQEQFLNQYYGTRSYTTEALHLVNKVAEFNVKNEELVNFYHNYFG